MAALAARRNFTAFKMLAWKRYDHARHLAIIDDALMQVELYIRSRGQAGIANLRIELPPRTGKSLTTARLFPAWFLGRNPDMRVILASYGESLAVKHSRYVRNIFKMPRYQQVFPGVRLAEDSQAKDAWDIALPYGGGMDAVGKGGAVTGKGANLIITDDLVKSRAEAESVVQRDKDWDWVQDDLSTRKEPFAAHVAVGTRWHVDDPHGRMEKYESDLWHRIRIPALADSSDDLLGRELGEAIWPERFSKADLELTHRRMGDYSFNALYQQQPILSAGDHFKREWFEPYRDSHPPIVRACRYWDLAMSDKTSADFTVGLKLGQATDGHYYVLDVARGRIGWADVESYMADVMLADGIDVPQGIEQKGYMSRAIYDLNMDGRLHGHQIRGFPADGNKLTRALPFAAKCGAGLIHVMNAHWTPAYVDELCSFDKGVHDDQVDASAGAWTMMDANNHYDGGMVYDDYSPLGDTF